MNEKDQEILYPTKQIGKEMTADFKENLAALKEILSPDISYDIVYRVIKIGGRDACLFFVDGFCKDELMQKILQYLIGLKPEDIPADAHGMSKGFMPTVEVDLGKTWEEIITALLSYERLAELLQRKHETGFLSQGLPEKEAKRRAEKKAIEDARFVLPNACATKLICTMNARELMNFFTHRCCNRAQWEIRELATEMLRLVREAAPRLFQRAGPPCLRGSCPEGKMSCGRMTEVRERFLKLGAGE